MAPDLSRWWAVDKIIVGYLLASGCFIAALWPRIPEAPERLAWHVLGILLILLAIRRQTLVSFIFRHWYPLPYVASCYKEMAIFIEAARRPDLDAQLTALDFRIWGVHASVWLERIQSPGLTEVMQILYSFFVPAVLFPAVLFWIGRRFREFRYYAFLIALGFLVSYIGYYIVPARGPRFILAGLQQIPLRGLWSYDWFRVTLDRLESAHYDCFPSGHTELTILAWWGTRRISAGLFRAYAAYTVCIIFATVYLRYHYTVDLMAGATVAAGLILLAPHLYVSLGKTRPFIASDRSGSG